MSETVLHVGGASPYEVKRRLDTPSPSGSGYSTSGGSPSGSGYSTSGGSPSGSGYSTSEEEEGR